MRSTKRWEALLAALIAMAMRMMIYPRGRCLQNQLSCRTLADLCSIKKGVAGEVLQFQIGGRRLLKKREKRSCLQCHDLELKHGSLGRRGLNPEL